MSAHLQGGKVDVSQIQNIARSNLLNLLEQCPGPKAIVWDNALAGPVGLIAQYIVLKEHSVTKMFPLRPDPLPETDVKHVIFISRPKLHLMDMVSKNILHDTKTAKKGSNKKQYHLFFVPKKSLICRNHLQHSGILGSVILQEFKCDFFPFDSDLISMEIPEVFREVYLENDPTYLYQTAQGLMFLQTIYGPFEQIWGKGRAAEEVWKLVQRLEKEMNLKEIIKNNQTCIDRLLLIDRSIDLITPLATQLTYEGLIDEIYGINNTTANFPADKFLSMEERKTESLAEDKKQIILNSADKLFVELRDKNFNAVSAMKSLRGDF